MFISDMISQNLVVLIDLSLFADTYSMVRDIKYLGGKSMKNILITGLAALSLAACGAAEEAVKDSGDAMKDAGAATVETTKKMADYVAPDILPAKFDGAAAGTYKVEKTHAFLTASVSHGGLSDYRMDFTDFDASLTFDPASASGMSIEFSVNPASVKTHYSGDYKAGHANSGFDTWDEQLGLSDKLLNAGKFPKATFTSNKVKRQGFRRYDIFRRFQARDVSHNL